MHRAEGDRQLSHVCRQVFLQERAKGSRGREQTAKRGEWHAWGVKRRMQELGLEIGSGLQQEVTSDL